MQGSLLLILRNSKFEVLAAHLAKNKLFKKKKEKKIKEKRNHRKYFPGLPFTLVVMTKKRVPVSQDESRGKGEMRGQLEEKEGQCNSFQHLGNSFLIHAALLIQKIQVSDTSFTLLYAIPVGVELSRKS